MKNTGMIDKTSIKQRVSTMISLLKEKCIKTSVAINDFHYFPADYKNGT